MKRILHVIDTTGPGGAETVFIQLLSKLGREKYKPVILIRGPGWVNEELNRRGFDPVILDAKGSFNFRYLVKLILLIRKEKIDLIQTHLLGSSVYGSIAGFFTRIPVVSTIHGMVDVEGERLLHTKFQIINKLSAAIVLVSKDLFSNLSSAVPINEGKLHIIYNGVDLQRYALVKNNNVKEELKLSPSVVLVGSVGNVRKAKAYDILLKAAAIVKNKNAKVKFAIVGDKENDLYRSLEKLKTELDLDDTVYFLGFRDNVPGFMSGIDVFLLSSISEGCPVSVVEAMASGVPMVVTDCGGLSEMVENGVNAAMCEPGSPEVLARNLIALIENRDLQKEIALEARKEAESRFSLDAMLQNYDAIYTELLKE